MIKLFKYMLVIACVGFFTLANAEVKYKGVIYPNTATNGYFMYYTTAGGLVDSPLSSDGVNVTNTGTFTSGTMTIGSGSITDSSGNITFVNENLVTTGTLGTGAITGPSLTNAAALTLSSSGAGVNVTTHSDATDDFTVNTTALVVEGDSGNVGIGTASPGAKLTVFDSGTALPTTAMGTGFVVARSDGLTGMSLGHLSTGNANYVQSDNFTNSDHLPLLLNPSGGNVGIGTTSPTAYNASMDDLVIYNSAGSAGLTLATGNTAATNYLAFADGTTGTDVYAGYIQYAHSANSMGAYVSGGTAGWIVDSTGAVTKPNNPAFLAYGATDQLNFTGDASAPVVEFSTEVFDQGSDYNNTTDTFTAPVTGRYQFNVSVRVDDLDTDTYEYGYLRLVTSNRSYYSQINPDGTAYNGLSYCYHLAVLADMDASDTAYVIVEVGDGTKTIDIGGSASLITYFSGYLAN
jgi:hypothetical protein